MADRGEKYGDVQIAQREVFLTSRGSDGFFGALASAFRSLAKKKVDDPRWEFFRVTVWVEPSDPSEWLDRGEPEEEDED